MSKILELAREAGCSETFGADAFQFTQEELTKFYTLARADLEAENFTLAAGQCVVDGGLLGDDGGTPYCSIQKRCEVLEVENAKLKSALNAMLTQFGMDEDEWSKPTFKQARAALGEQT